MNTPRHALSRWLGAGLCAAALGASPALLAQPTNSPTLELVRATELRADKLGAAPVLRQLGADAKVQLLEIEGGWAYVTAGGQTGWLRAGALKLPTQPTQLAALQTGRQASGNQALTLGVRSLPQRSNRHALIIGVGKYGDPQIPSLPGVKHDKHSATQMAQAMQVPLSNISYLHDEAATGDAIRKALRDLNSRVEPGDRVFIHYSGHGTRYNDPAQGGCVEAMLAYDGGTSGTITNKEVADLLKPITEKTNKLFVMYDACHSGGLVANTSVGVRSRSALAMSEAPVRPKFSNISEECGRPVNMKTRNLTVEQVTQGALPQDIIHLSAARHNEMSFDDEEKGGLATQFMRDCMLRDAKDTDGSGTVSIDEIKACAQEKINNRMRNDVMFKPHSLVLTGNPEFVPAWFAQAAAPVAVAAVANAAPVAAAASAAPAAPPPPPPPPLTGAQALDAVFVQADAKRKVTLTAARTELKIGKDEFDFTVQSNRAGFVYVALAGSDNKSMYLLFPNTLDGNNRIEANKPMNLPRKDVWRVRAAGPAGQDTLLVIVSDTPRDVSQLLALDPNAKVGPFVRSLNDANGRASLGALLVNTPESCTGKCSDAFGAAKLVVTEVQ